MERDKNQDIPTNKADAPAEQSQKEEPVATAAQIEVKDFSPPASQDQDQENTLRGAKGSQGQETAQAFGTGDSGPGFVDINGDVGGHGHNETVVDIVAVPCPGADSIKTWTYDSEFYGDASVHCEFSVRSSVRSPSPWVTKKLRNSASIARVLLYRHRALEDGMTLQSLAEDLLDQVERIRNGAVGVLPLSSSSCRADSHTAIAAPFLHRPQHRWPGRKKGLGDGEPVPQLPVDPRHLSWSFVLR